MRITEITTHAVGNRWKNWLFVRIDTDEGIHGLGEGSLNGFCRAVEAAVHELEPMVIGRDPFATESLVLHLSRDLYSDGGQIHGAAIAAIEIACWDTHYGMIAPHNAQGPVCSMVSLHLGASTTNFYYLESFEDFNESWTRDIVIGDVLVVADGCVEVSRAPGLGIDLDWDALSDHPYRPDHVLRLHHDGWERRVPQALVD